jgi:hypothetical protein
MTEQVPINPVDFAPEIVDQSPQLPQQIDFSTEEQPSQIDMAPVMPTSNTFPINNETIPKRAFKAAYGLSTTPAAKPVENFIESLSSGREYMERSEAAAKLNEALANKRYDIIAEALSDFSTPITPERLAEINAIYSRTYSPENVFEQNYARNYVAALDNFASRLGSDHFWNVANLEHPSNIEAARKWGTLALAQREVAETLREGVRAKMEATPPVTYSEYPNIAPGYEDTVALARDGDYDKYSRMIVELGKIMGIPGYHEYYMRGQVPGVSFFEGITKGEHIELARNKLRSLPFDEYTQTLTNITNLLSSFNTHLADDFLSKMIGQTSIERFLDNMDTAVNAATIAYPFAKFGLSLAKGEFPKSVSSVSPEVDQAIAAVKDVIKSADGLPRTENIVAATGDLQEAGRIKATENLTNALKGTSQSEREAIEALPAHLRADRIDEKANPGILSTTQANIIEQDSRAFERNAMDALGNTLKVQRVPIESFSRKTIDDIIAAQAERYPGINNGIIKLTDPVYDPFSNTYEVNFWVGRQGGILFRNQQEAEQFARAHGFSKDQVVQNPQRGLGWAIEIRGVKLDETGSVIRDNIVHPSRVESISPSLREDQALLSRYIPFLDYIRSPEETLSAEQRALRKVATYPQAELRRVAIQEAEIIRDLARGIKRFDSEGNPLTIPRYFPGISGLVKKNKWNDFKRMLDLARKTPDPVTNRMGYFASNPHELQDQYLTHIGRIPTFEEQRAYFANKRLVEYDRMLRTISMYRNKARVGAENFQIVSHGVNPNKPGIGHNQGPALEPDFGEIRSVPFDGVARKTLPSKGNILVMGDDVSSSKVHQLDSMLPRAKRRFENEVASGKSTLIEVYDPEHRPFNGFVDGGERYIRYVLVKNFERKPISWNDQVNRVGGGHFVWEYDHYVKQARVIHEEVNGRHTYRYEGDETVIPVMNRAEGRQFTNLLNQIRLLLKDGKEAEAAVLGKQLPPGYSFDDFKAAFHPKKDENNVIHPPRFNYDEPFHVVPNNRAIIDMDNNLKRKYPENVWRDGTRESLARNFQVEYTRERDSHDLFGPVKNRGTKENPVWNIEPGRMLDPIVTANRGLNRIIGSSFMEDYKASAVESWLREAMPYLNATPREIQSSPYHYFYNPEFLKGTPYEIKYPLLANRFKIRQLVGTPNDLERYLYSMTQALYDSAYLKPKGVGGKAAELTGKALTVIDPLWKINYIKDPVRVIKTLTFDMLMGLFSIPQFFVQQMTWVNIGAVSPRSVEAATMASLFAQWTRFAKSPETVKMLDNVAVKMGILFPGARKFKPGEFTEALDLLHRSGYGVVGGEFSMLDNNRVANIIQNGMDRFADWSRFFFKEGERSPRYGSWFTAYLEYREKNPTKKITNTEAAKILDRADFLYNNMSVASHSVLHTGPLALMTQFYQYQIRLGEILTSKRLAGGLGDTQRERNLTRMRLILANSAMFGIPGAVGLSMLPIGDWLRGKAIEHGYQPNQMAALDIAINGFPAWATAMATGTVYNIGSRYGQQGPTFLKDMVNGEASIYRIGAGASANVLFNTFGPNKEGLVDAFMAIARGDFETYPPKWQDVIKFASEAKSVSATQQLYIALTTGEWVNKRKEFVEDVSAKEAWFRYISGLRSQQEADVWPMNNNIAERDKVERDALKRFDEEMNLSLIAHANNDPQGRDDHYSRAVAPLVAIKMDPDKINEALAKVKRNNQSLIDRTNFKFFVTKAPVEKRRQYLDIYQDIPPRGTR